MYLGDGSTTDIVAVTLPAFFVRTPEDFLEFVHARTPDPSTGEPDPTRIGAFVNAHPESLSALGAVLASQPPESYLRCAYNALHAYLFTAADETVRAGRYHLEPAEGVAAIAPEEAERRGPNYLRDDLANRLASGPAEFTVFVSIAESGDPIDDPTAVWPEERERVAVGHITVTGLASDRDDPPDVLVFDPTRVTDGIELSGDPILRFRSAAYADSVLRRSGVARD
jgi:catalase